MDKKNKNSINDVEDHLNKISGNPAKINTSGVPKGIRIVGYFFITFFVLLILTVNNVLNLPNISENKFPVMNG